MAMQQAAAVAKHHKAPTLEMLERKEHLNHPALEALDGEKEKMVNSILNGLADISSETIHMADGIKKGKKEKNKSEIAKSVIQGLLDIGKQANKMASDIKKNKLDKPHHHKPAHH